MSLLWSIVLAAGRGRRLASVTGRVPKQFWAPPGGRSLLEETHTRIAPMGDPSRTLTVVDRSHRPHIEGLGRSTALGTTIYQPADRGTANGLLLALSVVASRDPNATVFMTPSDHGVARPEWFHAGVRAAITHATTRPDDIVLLGAEASSPSTDYGWIVPVRGGHDGLPVVASFVEKPARPLAVRLMAAGAIWNTMVLVARAAAILDLYRRHLPDLVAAFESVRPRGVSARREALDALYVDLPAADLSHDVLARARGLRCLTIGRQAGWTDLGTPDRLADWLNRTGAGEGELARQERDDAPANATTVGPVPA